MSKTHSAASENDLVLVNQEHLEEPALAQDDEIILKKENDNTTYIMHEELDLRSSLSKVFRMSNG